MYRQFSYLSPLQTTERELKILNSKKKFKFQKFGPMHYKEMNWIKSWGRKDYFSYIPFNNTNKTAEF